MKLYHSTSRRAAKAILRKGFRDNTGSYGFATLTLTGVFFADQPVDENEGAASSEVVIVVDLDEAKLIDFEIVQEGSGFREWCIPAEVVNPYPRRTLDDRENVASRFVVPEGCGY